MDESNIEIRSNHYVIFRTDNIRIYVLMAIDTIHTIELCTGKYCYFDSELHLNNNDLLCLGRKVKLLLQQEKEKQAQLKSKYLTKFLNEI